MQINKKDFISDYVVEAQEYLDSLDDICIKLYKSNRDEKLLKEVLRLLHTLKGSSRMLEFTQIEKLVNALETVFKVIQNNQTEVASKKLQLLMNTNAVIRETVQRIQDKPEDELSGVITGFDFILKNIEAAAADQEFEVEFAAVTQRESDKKALAAEDTELFHDSQTIKVQISQINSILQEFDKLIMRQIRLKNQIENLQMQENSNNFQVMHDLDENLSVLETESFSIQEKIIKLRMLPFDMILQPIKRSLVNEAIKLGKNVDIDIPNSEITIDKSILEKLPKILIHLVRNSIDHGIESPEERKKAKKSEKGKVSISVAQVSNRIFVTVSDDGRGFDYEKIRSKAMRLYPDREAEIELMEKEDLMQFIFASGFSTRDTQTELSGRGIGMDVVRAEMDRLKGRIHIESEWQKGTSIELSLPASLATQDGLFVRVGGSKYLVLSHYIREIVTVNKNQFLTLQKGPVLNLHKELIPVYDFDSITGNLTDSVALKKSDIPVVVIEYLNRKIAVIADEILNYTTVVIKPLPPILKKFQALQGIVFDENYSIIPVLNIPDSMRRFKSINFYNIKNLEVHKQPKSYSILVADDSATTRHIEQVILEAEGYKVTTVCDGIEALEKLRQFNFDLVVTDVKMPRMDGFILIQNMRHIDKLKNIPVIVISSVFESDTLTTVKELNAQYIVKSDFERENLIEKVKELLHDE